MVRLKFSLFECSRSNNNLSIPIGFIRGKYSNYYQDATIIGYFITFVLKSSVMNEVIYRASDDSNMDKNSLIAWLSEFKVYHPEFANWNFDEITGGPDCFFESNDYYETKEFFEKFIG